MQVFGDETPSLVIGQRTNLDLKTVDLYNLYQPTSVEPAAGLHGNLFTTDAEDYFFIKKNVYPWHLVPDIAVGRKAYDNFIVAIGIMNNVSVVDATRTMVALHQTDDDGNYAGHQNPENNINTNAIGEFNYYNGLTSGSPYYSQAYEQNNSGIMQSVIGIYNRRTYQLVNSDVKR
jgi:hypothetical protein